MANGTGGTVPVTIADLRLAIKHMKTYEAMCKSKQIDALEPPAEMLMAWIFGLTGPKTLCLAVERIRALTCYFRLHGAPDLTQTPGVQRILEPIPGWPLSPSKNERSARARFYATQAYAPKVLMQWYRYIDEWRLFTVEHHVEALYPSTDAILWYLASKAETMRFSSVKSNAAALRFFFKRMGVIDQTRSERVKVFLEGLQKEKPVRSEALFSDELRKLLNTFGAKPRDLHHRLVLICCYFGPMRRSVLQRLQRNTTTIGPEATTFGLGPKDEPWRIGHSDDPDFDLRIWLPKWLAVIGTKAGPLFPGWRGDRWTSLPMSNNQARLMTHEAARLAGIPERAVFLALQKGFVVRGTRKMGAVITATQARYKTLSIIRYHAPFVALINSQIKLRHRRILLRQNVLNAPT